MVSSVVCIFRYFAATSACCVFWHCLRRGRKLIVETSSRVRCQLAVLGFMFSNSSSCATTLIITSRRR